MDILIDTHAVLWFITEDNRLPKRNFQIIEDLDNRCFVSIASLWEIGIKHSLDRLEVESDLNEIFDLIVESGFDLLPLTSDHILTASSLEFHHRDPFDRILIGQAKSEGCQIMTKDKRFEKYQVEIVWNLQQ